MLSGVAKSSVERLIYDPIPLQIINTIKEDMIMNQTVLETLNLTKSFGATKVVDDLNLQVESGDIFGFLGPNGSGKTTTIRLVLHLIHPHSGRVFINGHDVHTDFLSAISQVGAIVETPQFYTYLSGRDNLQHMANLIPNLPKSRVEEVLEIVGMSKRANDKVKTYSLGMKQRLGIARALLNNPKLVILDEPTNGLDPQGLIEVREMIARLAAEQQITFFISTHLLHEVEHICNKVAVLQRGKLLTQGKVADLLNTENEVVEVCTPSPKEAMGTLHGLTYVKSMDPSPRGFTIHLEKGHSAELNRYLIQHQVTVDYLIPQQQSLEKYFLELTKGGDQIA
jgi:ABC-2 type transport system ATP-binding protein